jgi:hypothetical protein
MIKAMPGNGGLDRKAKQERQRSRRAPQTQPHVVDECPHHGDAPKILPSREIMSHLVQERNKKLGFSNTYAEKVLKLLSHQRE